MKSTHVLVDGKLVLVATPAVQVVRVGREPRPGFEIASQLHAQRAELLDVKARRAKDQRLARRERRKRHVS